MGNNTRKLIKEEEKALRKRKKLNTNDKDAAKENESNISIGKELVEDISKKIVADIDNSSLDELYDTTNDTEEKKRLRRKRRIVLEKKQERLKRENFLKENQLVEAVVPISLQQKFLYYTTSIKSLEKKIRKLKILVVFFVVVTLVLTSMYLYERGETKRTYEHMYARAVQDTLDTIEGYQNNPMEDDKFSRMLIGEVNTVRMAAEQLGEEDKYTNRLNDIYYFMVDYPQQIKKHYEELKEIYSLLKLDITNKEAYEKIDNLEQAIDKYGK